MKIGRHWRAVLLLTVGLMGGYLIGPPVVHAATQLVTIRGGGSTHEAKVDAAGRLFVSASGTTSIKNVGVNKANQLFTGQAAPANYQVIFLSATPDCSTPAYTVPAGEALILTETTFVVAADTPGAEGYITLDTGTNGVCTAFVAVGLTQSAGETVNQSYPTGIPFPTGTQLSAVPFRAAGSVFAYGYLVPAGAVSVQQLKGLPRIPLHGLLGRSASRSGP
jgi:hypothetical protein